MVVTRAAPAFSVRSFGVALDAVRRLRGTWHLFAPPFAFRRFAFVDAARGAVGVVVVLTEAASVRGPVAVGGLAVRRRGHQRPSFLALRATLAAWRSHGGVSPTVGLGPCRHP